MGVRGVGVARGKYPEQIDLDVITHSVVISLD